MAIIENDIAFSVTKEQRTAIRNLVSSMPYAGSISLGMRPIDSGEDVVKFLLALKMELLETSTREQRANDELFRNRRLHSALAEFVTVITKEA